MEQPKTWIEILPQLSTAVVAIAVLGIALYYMLKYLEKRDQASEKAHAAFRQEMRDMREAHTKQIDERETAMRAQEKEFRDTLGAQLHKNTEVMSQSAATILSATKAMDRMTQHLDQAVHQPPRRRRASPRV